MNNSKSNNDEGQSTTNASAGARRVRPVSTSDRNHADLKLRTLLCTCHHWVSQSTYLRMIGLIHSYFRYLPQAFTSPNWNCGKKSSCDVQFGILLQILFSLIWNLDFRREIYSFKLSHYLNMYKEGRFVAHRRGWLKTKESSTCSGKKVEHFADPIYYPLLYAPPVRNQLCGGGAMDGFLS
jgi:hypothetical protein